MVMVPAEGATALIVPMAVTLAWAWTVILAATLVLTSYSTVTREPIFVARVARVGIVPSTLSWVPETTFSVISPSVSVVMVTTWAGTSIAVIVPVAKAFPLTWTTLPEASILSTASGLISKPLSMLPLVSIPTWTWVITWPPLICTWLLAFIWTSGLLRVSSWMTGAKMYRPSPVMCKDWSATKSKVMVVTVPELTVKLPFSWSLLLGSLASQEPLPSTTTTLEMLSLTWS